MVLLFTSTCPFPLETAGCLAYVPGTYQKGASCFRFSASSSSDIRTWYCSIMRVAFFYSSVWSRDCNVQHAVQQQYRPSLRIPEIGHGLAFVLIRCVLHFLTSWSLPCDRGLHCSHELRREQQQQLLLLSAVLCPWCLGPRPARGRGQQNIMLTVLCIACS